MLKKVCFMVLLLACSGATPQVMANACLPKISKSDIGISLLPLDGSSLGFLIPLLLRDYLSHVSGLAPSLSITPKNLQGGTYTLTGSVTRKSQGYEVTSKLLSPDKNAKEAIVFSGTFEFPNGLNDFLIALTEKIASSLGKKFQDKKVLPYLNRTSSAEAYLSYAEGMRTLPTIPDRAISFFKKAVEKDYNYVPAYLGVAEALARTGAKGHARRELTKAKLLNPVLTKEREECIESLIQTRGKITALPPNPSSGVNLSDRLLRLTGRNKSDPVNTRSLSGGGSQ